MTTQSSSGSDDQSPHTTKLFGRQRPLHDAFGGGKVADVVLWRNKNLSATTLAGFTLIWLLFDVYRFRFLKLLCYLTILDMCLVFIWSNDENLRNRHPPNIPEIILSGPAFKEVATILHAMLIWLTSILHGIARGKDLNLFFWTVISLWIFTIGGSYYCSSLSLVYYCFVCILTFPAIYEKFEDEVDHLARKVSRDLKILYRQILTQILNNAPRIPAKQYKI